MNLTVYRTKDWLVAKRLETGTNVPEQITVEVSIGELSQEVRKLLLECDNGTYPENFHALGWTKSGSLDHRFNGYGTQYIVIDSDAPTLDQIEAALLGARDVVAGELARQKADHDQREAEQRAEQGEKDRKRQLVAAAHEVLKDELATMQAQLTSAIKDRVTLADFLSDVPQDALRGTLKAKIADGSGDRIHELQKLVEDASPYQVFRKQEDDEE